MKDPLEDLLLRLERCVQVVKAMRRERKLLEHPPGHPEEPADIRKWREQNPSNESEI